MKRPNFTLPILMVACVLVPLALLGCGGAAGSDSAAGLASAPTRSAPTDASASGGETSAAPTTARKGMTTDAGGIEIID